MINYILIFSLYNSACSNSPSVVFSPPPVAEFLAIYFIVLAAKNTPSSPPPENTPSLQKRLPKIVGIFSSIAIINW